jgi:tetratricopeptide (TPR) repeat protein
MATFMERVHYPFDLGLRENEGNNDLQLLHFSSGESSEYLVTELGRSGAYNEVQIWLSRGLVWYYGFNHEEAIYCFEKALNLDKNCVMAHYGISISHGPNYNTETMNRDTFPSATAAFEHCQKALSLLSNEDIRAHLSEIEIGLVEALACRFKDPATFDADISTETAAAADPSSHSSPSSTSSSPLPPTPPIEQLPIEQNTDEFAEAMRQLYDRYPTDPTVAAMYAEALMNKSPWELWNLTTGVPEPYTLIAHTVLDAALEIAPNHPGLNHFKIHLMEMSPTPELSLASCAVLRKVCPSAGHLIHMPSHIYVLLGMWQEAVEANKEAAAVDELYVLKEGIYNYYTGYRIHNLHFIAYAAMFAGQFQVAMQAAQEVKKNLPYDLLKNPVMNKFFESFYSIELHVLLRFGKWEEILSHPPMQDEKVRRMELTY